MRSRLRAGIHPGVLFLLFLAVAAGIAFYYLKIGLAEKKVHIEKAIAYLQSEYPFAEIAVKRVQTNEMDVTLRILDVSGQTVGTKDYSLRGRDIFLENRVVVLTAADRERSMVFPVKLYTESVPPTEGDDLLPLYSVDNYPDNYRNQDAELSNAVRYVFRRAFELSNAGREFGETNVRISVSMDAVLHRGGMGGFEAGKSYRCVVHPNGGLELREVK
jgi:hypothetical protein